MQARSSRTSSVLVACALALTSLSTSTPAADAGATNLTFDPEVPVPFEPFDVTVTESGYAPFESVELTLGYEVFWQDTIGCDPIATQTVTADAEGDVEATLSGVAYPGRWNVDVGGACFGGTQFDIAPPPDFTMTFTPAAVRVGDATEMTFSGAGCPGTTARWNSGWDPIVTFGSGTAPVGNDGRWSGTSTMVVPDIPFIRQGLERHDAFVLLQVACIVDGHLVRYPGSFIPVLPPVPVPPVSEPELEPSAAVAPRFTG